MIPLLTETQSGCRRLCPCCLRCRIIPLACLLFLMTFVSGSFAFAESEMRPNIILIMADDLGYECLQANGGTSYLTPRLNQMAEEGIRFTEAFSQPICTPTRVQLMTGKYNQRNYVRFGYLEPSQKTFAHYFREAGYKTAIAGKWQLEGGLTGPNHFGFDQYCLWQLTRRPSRYPSPGLEIDGQEQDFPGRYGPDIVSDYLCQFIENHKQEPFLLYYPMILPHWPFEPTPDSAEWNPESRGAVNSQKEKRFFADMVTYTDKMVGKIIDQVHLSGIDDRTYILFTGDNGTAQGVISRMGEEEVPGGKGLTTRNGMHVPLIVQGPATVASGSVCDDLIDFTDILPTLLEMAEIPLPEKEMGDGRSFLPQIHGQIGQPRESIYCWYARNGGQNGIQFTQNKIWKVYRDGRIFQILNDPYETEDQQANLQQLSADDQQQIKKLSATLNTYRGTRQLLEPLKETPKQPDQQNKRARQKS